jgi:hypothetical protein
LSKKEVDDAVIEKAKTFAGSKVGGAKIAYVGGGAQVSFQCSKPSSGNATILVNKSGRNHSDAS